MLSPDKYVQDATNSQDYNRYSYVRNNPLKYTDPSGWVLKPLPDMIENTYNGDAGSGGGSSGGGNSNLWSHATGGSMYNSGYNYQGSYSVFASNPTMYATIYGSQTPMQIAVQKAYEEQKKREFFNNPKNWTKTVTRTTYMYPDKDASPQGEDKVGYGGIFVYATKYTLNWINDDLYGEHKPAVSAIADFSLGVSDMAIVARLSNVSNVYQKLRSTAPLWTKYSTIINPGEYQVLSKTGKIIGKIAVPLAVVTTLYSGVKVVDQYQQGGLSKVNGWDAADFTVGFTGLATTGLAAIGMVSNPVGWAIGAGCLIYGGVRIGMDIYDAYNKP